MALARELAAAVESLTVIGRRRGAPPPSTAAAALAFYPIVGLALGLAAAAGAAVPALVRDGAPAFAGAAAGLLVLVVLSAGRPLVGLAAAADALLRGARTPAAGALGLAVGVLTLAVRLWAAARLPEAARTAAFVLAPMLGRWAIVVQCYGGAPGEGPVGRARFREFGAASVVAFAVTLGLVEAAGLVVLVSAALVTVGVRLWAYRRLGRPGRPVLDATAELVETVTFVVLALLARIVTPGAALVRAAAPGGRAS